MKNKTVLSVLSNALVARANCEKSGNSEFYAKWEALITQIEKNCLPSGSGFDSGTEVDIEKSNGQTRIVFTTAFHHMDENGYYDGWTEHTVTASPCLLFGFNLKVSGRNRNEIKDYIDETFSHALQNECAETLANV
jgi:hypothetical protein